MNCFNIQEDIVKTRTWHRLNGIIYKLPFHPSRHLDRINRAGVELFLSLSQLRRAVVLFRMFSFEKMEDGDAGGGTSPAKSLIDSRQIWVKFIWIHLVLELLEATRICSSQPWFPLWICVDERAALITCLTSIEEKYKNTNNNTSTVRTWWGKW